MLPGVDVTSGSETATVKAFDIAAGPACDTFTATAVCSLEITGAILLCKPKNSVAESIKAKWEPPAPNVVMVVNRANRIATIATP